MQAAQTVEEILRQARDLAVAYRKLTGKPLGISGEMGEYFVSTLLKHKLAEARTPGYDSTCAAGYRYQIKARVVRNGKTLGGQRIGSIKFNHEWDKAILVLMNEDYDPIAIYEADRQSLKQALESPGSISRNKRGSLHASKFKSIGRLLWKPTNC